MKPTRGKTPKKTPRRGNQNKTKDPVEVYSRVRPLEDSNGEVCLKILSSTAVQLTPPLTSHAYKNGNYKESTHTFKYVFGPESSQKAIFDNIALALIDDLLHGKNGLLFMYGITNSGKTHTMQGTTQEGGVLPRCLDVIFNSLGDLQAKKYVFRPDRANGMDVQTEADAMMERQKKDLMPLTQRTTSTPRRKEKEDFSNIVRVPDTTRVNGLVEDNMYSVFVSYVEIYNNYIYDLLEEMPDTISAKSLPSKSLREDSNHNMYVANCNEVEVKSADEAYIVFLKGQKQRKVAHTKLNTESSRSHSVFNIRLVQAPLDPAGEEVLQDKNEICLSQLSLVDLAGSERTHRTKTSGDRLREAGNINASLMTLRTCIELLRENQTNNANKIVPYRDSKVTHLFKNYFDGEGKVRMVVCVNPKAADYDETTHVMRFAEVTQEVQIARPSGPKFETGLTPGRRRAHQMYRKMLEQEGTPRASLPARPAVITLGPPFPALQMNDPNEDVISNLLSFLAEREKRRNILDSERLRKEEAFRLRLQEFERETEAVRAANLDLQKEVDRYKKKVRIFENEKENINRGHDEAFRGLQNELAEKDKKLQKEMQERDKLRLALKGVQQSEKERWEKEMGKRVKANKMEYENKLWVKNAQLDQLKQIVCGSGSGDVLPAEEDQVMQEVEEPAVRPKTKPTLNRSQSPPPKRTAPPVKVRHRRSRSTSNAVWVDHKPASTLNTETVLQPVGPKKKKTVNTPSVKDLKNTDNYMVTHQEEDSKGEVETRIYKADVLTTRGGGRSVQFTDVEQLKTGSPTNSPTNRKRKSDEDGEARSKEEVESRCSYGYASRAGQSQPSVNHTVPSKKFRK
ncbi:kinesin-like protein KIF23 isoform X3 [Apostichopus japonicus]|uniref:kinesin-like protein KIF23 isoform X3 n=1 Tax=Stichopus japonicus TaxID=307972 RepID=UPI003AB88E93